VGLLLEALPASTLVVAIDPGEVSHRVWLSSSGAGPGRASLTMVAASGPSLH
jgi:hypothetical protein